MATIDNLEIQFTAKTDEAIQKIREMAAEVSKLADAMKATESTKLGSSITNAVSDLKQVEDQAKNTADAIKEVTKKMSQNSVSAAPSPASKEPSFSQIQATVAPLEKVASRVDTIKQKFQGIVVPTKELKKLEEQAEGVARKYDDLRKKMQDALDNGNTKSNSPKYKEWERDLESLRNEYDRLIQKQKELALSDAVKINPNFSKAYKGVAQSIGGVKQAFKGISSVVQTANSYIDKFLSKMKSMGSASKKAKTNTSSLIDVLKKMGKEITRVTKMLKLMITRMALRAVIKEVGNGFKSLALHSEEFNKSVSSVMNNSKQLGYSFAAMVSPIINALAPALVYLINLFTQLVNIINQVFSALGGGTTWNKAKSFTDDWAKSIQAGNKSAKELKKTVLGFDELNQLQDNKNSGGGANDITDMFETKPIESKWADLADKIKQIAKDLFEPIKEAWRKVGEFVQSSWAYAMRECGKLLQSLARDFMKVWQQEATQKIFEAILESIAWIGIAVGNLARQFRLAWDENETGLHILEAIRDIILIIVTHIRDMARATAEWAGTLDFSPLLVSIKDWLESLKPAVDAVMGILEDFYNEVVLKFTKWVIESGLPALIDVFTRFNQEVDWEGLRSKLAELWKHLEPFMETVGEGLIIFVERITTALKDFINGEEFADFLKKVEEWMDSVTPEDVANAMEKLVKALIAFKVAFAAISLLSGAASVLSSIFTVCKGLGAIAGGVAKFVTAIGGLSSAILPIVAIASAVAFAIYSLITSYGGLEEVVNKIKETISGAVEKIKEYAEYLGIGEQIEELKGAFDGLLGSLGGLKSLWDVFFYWLQQTAIFLSRSVLPLIRDFIKLTKDSINAFSGIIKAVGGMFDILVGLFTGDSEKIKQGAQNLWDGIKQFFSSGVKYIVDLVGGLVDLIIAPFNMIKYYLIGDPIVVDMWEGIKDIFEKSIGKVVDFVTGLKDDVIKLFTEICDKVKQKIDDIKTKFGEWSTKTKEIKDSIKQSIETVKTEINSKLDTVKSKVKEFKDDWTQKWSDAKNKISEFKTNAATQFDEIKTKILTFKDTIKSAFSVENWTFSGVAEGLKKTFESAKEAIAGVWNAIADKVNGEHDIGGSSFRINLPKFATGGFPPENGLFMANSTELVGEFSNGRTAVANNAQIVEGIQNGVYNAVMSAMSQQSGTPTYISNEISIDGEVFGRSITKAVEKQNRRFSPSMT